MDSYTVNVSSNVGQHLCESQTIGGNETGVVLNVTGCVICRGSNKCYAITVEASNRGGQTVSTTGLCKTITYHIVGIVNILISMGYVVYLNS